MKEQSLKVVEEEAFESQARAFDHRVIISTCYPASAGPALPGLAGLRELSVSRGGSAGRLCCVWSSSSLGRCLAWAGPPPGSGRGAGQQLVLRHPAGQSRSRGAVVPNPGWEAMPEAGGQVQDGVKVSGLPLGAAGHSRL